MGGHRDENTQRMWPVNEQLQQREELRMRLAVLELVRHGGGVLDQLRGGGGAPACLQK